MNTPARVAHPLLTLSVALVFAAIFLFGGQIATRLGPMGLRRFLSFAAGISLAYTFVHVLPALGAIQDLQTEHPTPRRRSRGDRTAGPRTRLRRSTHMGDDQLCRGRSAGGGIAVAHGS